MQSKIAVMAIIVENVEMVSKLNECLHDYGEYIIGRMGIPYKERKINVISIVLEASQDVISALAGKVGNISGVSVKTALSSLTFNE